MKRTSKPGLPRARTVAMSLLAVGALWVSTVAPADAGQVIRTDARGDVWEPHGLDGWVRARSVPNVDVRRFRVRNEAHRVVVAARYTDLVANDDELTLDVDFKSQGTPVRTLSVSVGMGSAEGYFVITTDIGVIDCDLAGKVDYETETIRVVVPHHCIGAGSWLRFDAMNRRYNEESGVLYDDPVTGRGNTYKWSAKVRRGHVRAG